MTRRSLLTLAILATLSLGGCRHAAPDENRAPSLVSNAPVSDPVVATVDGRPIRASDVAAQARAAGTSVKQALDDLIDAEALAGEAARRHLDRDPDVRAAAREESVRRLLALDFETSATVDAIPSRAVKSAYSQNQSFFDHDEEVDVWHILVPVPKRADAALRQAALSTAEDLARRAKGVGSLAAFQALATQVKPPRGIAPLKLEHIVTAKDGWTLHTFSYPAFALRHPGDTSGVVETSYGYHVIFLVGRIAARHEPLAAAEPDVRAHLLPDFRKAEFKTWVERAMQRHHIAVYPDHLPRGDEAPNIK